MEFERIEINGKETEAQRLGRMVKYLRLLTGMKRENFANLFSTLQRVNKSMNKRYFNSYIFEPLIESEQKYE